MRMLSLFLRYGDNDYYGAINRLCLLYQNIDGLEYDVLLIDNSLSTDIQVNIGPNIVMVGGDNTRREFSGWHSVLKRFPYLMDGYDLVNIVTSAFENEYSGFYQHINSNTFEYAVKNENVVLAHIDAYPDSVRLYGRSFQTWGCSKFILTVPERINKLDTFVGDFSGEDFFSCNTDEPFKKEAPLSENYRAHLLNWVTGSGLPHGQWHSVFELSNENIKRFFSKAMSIIDEHSLSMRFRETGARIIDFTWLHSKKSDVVVKSIPDEVTQVQERNLFLFEDPIIDAHLDLADYPTERTIEWVYNSAEEMKKVFGRTSLIDALWIGNSDLRESLDLNCELHVAAIYLEQGLEINEKQRAWLSEIDNNVEQDVVLPITKGLHALYLARGDIRQSFDLTLREGRKEYILWWVRSGIYQPDLSGFITENIYSEVDNTLVQDAPLPITKGLHALWCARDDLNEKFDLATAEGRRSFIYWWIVNGISDHQISSYISKSDYLEIDDTIEQDASSTIAKGLHVLYCARRDLQNKFAITTREGREELLHWYQDNLLDDISDRFLSGSNIVISTNQLTKMSGMYMQGGVNIIGFARGELGIGEDVRMASMALRSEDIDQCVPIIPLQLGTRQEDRSLQKYEVAYPLYNVNLIYLPHYETIRLAGATGDLIFGHRNNIACWQWELPKFPKGMELALGLVDEIWSSTKFTADAMKSVTDKPVYVMPMAVCLPEITYDYKRAEFGLPADDFVFLNVMDGNSSIHRKNPLAAIKAFLMAFPKGMRGVHMLVKTMNMDASSSEWDELLRLSSKDDRITIISETMERQKVIGLQAVCDCFVSLHRAEGFGRNIAEAMILGKPVIVSKFSGNTDFTNDKTAFMVDGETVPVKPNEYTFSEGQYWWDADVVSAAEMMRLCIDDDNERKLRADAGQAFVSKHYSPESVGKKYFERLNSLSNSLAYHRG